MISMTGYNVRGEKFSWHYPYSGVWIIEQETFSIGLQMFLLKHRSTIDMLRDRIDMVFRWRSNFGNTKDPSGITCRISLTISSRKNGCPCKRNYNDRSSTQGGGARHDIMLPGHQRTNVITLENMFQPSYLTVIQIRLVSGYLRLRIPEKKRCNANWQDDIVRFSGKWTMKWFPLSRVHH